MEVYFYGSYAMSQKGFYFSRLKNGQLYETTDLPQIINSFFSYDAFWLVWRDIDEENIFFPKATQTFFGVRHLKGQLDGREAYMNLAFLGSIEEVESFKKMAMHWFHDYNQLENKVFECMSLDEHMCFQLDAQAFFGLFSNDVQEENKFTIPSSPLSIRGLIHYAVCSYDWENTSRYLKPNWLWRKKPHHVFSAQEFRSKEEC